MAQFVVVFSDNPIRVERPAAQFSRIADLAQILRRRIFVELSVGFGVWRWFGAAAEGLPALMPHLGDRPGVLHGPFEPHLGIFPVERRLEVAPIEPWYVSREEPNRS